MIASSRPLRFVVLLLGGWVAMRTVQLWPVPAQITAIVPALLDVVAPPAEAEPSPVVSVPAARLWSNVTQSKRSPSPSAGLRPLIAHPRARDVVQSALTTPGISNLGLGPVAAAGPIGSPIATEPSADMPSRLRVSVWTIVRGGGAASPFTPQLGGSQAGLRATYAIDEARRIALGARLSTALGSRQREAAIGFDWQPTALPVHLIAEQRIGIEGVHGGPSIGLIAGFGPTPVAAGFGLEAYGQAGGIARDGRIEGYADGAARAVRPVTVGAVTIDFGLGAWGGAQRGAERLDLGPTASASLPIGAKSVRVALDWRQRVAGDARPGSGPALSIGTDF